MKKETIERNKNKIKEIVLDNREVFKQLMKDSGNGWEIDIDKDDVLVENVYEQLEDTDEYTQSYDTYFDYFDWLFYEDEDEDEEEHYKPYTPEFYYDDYEIHYGW